MKLTRALAAVLMVVVWLNLWGCCGGSKEVAVPSQTTTTTLGQELQDLDEAYKKGAITQEQYEAAKKKILEQRAKEK